MTESAEAAAGQALVASGASTDCTQALLPPTWRRFSCAALVQPARESMVTLPAAASGASSASSHGVHVSLSRTVVLKRHQIDDCMQLIREQTAQLRNRRPLQLQLRGSKLYWNDERTRCFAALLLYPFQSQKQPQQQEASADVSHRPAPLCCAHECCSPTAAAAASEEASAVILQLIQRIDAILQSFGQATYYDPPELHATVAWALPPAVLAPAGPSKPAASADVRADASGSVSSFPLTCICSVDRMHVSIGNRLYTLPFQPQPTTVTAT